MRVHKENRNFSCDPFSDKIIQYDIDELCEKADSVYWTLVPYELISMVNNPYQLNESDSFLIDLNTVSSWWED